MTVSKCRERPLISRAGPAVLLLAILGSGPLVAQQTMLPKEAARRQPTPARSARKTAAYLVRLIEAIAQARFDDAEVELQRARAAVPAAAETELLAAVLYGSRYLLEGSADQRLLDLARKGLETYRRRGGSLRGEEAWLSPSLRGLLGD